MSENEREFIGFEEAEADLAVESLELVTTTEIPHYVESISILAENDDPKDVKVSILDGTDEFPIFDEAGWTGKSYLCTDRFLLDGKKQIKVSVAPSGTATTGVVKARVGKADL
jgi:hypothetical protein